MSAILFAVDPNTSLGVAALIIGTIVLVAALVGVAVLRTLGEHEDNVRHKPHHTR